MNITWPVKAKTMQGKTGAAGLITDIFLFRFAPIRDEIMPCVVLRHWGDPAKTNIEIWIWMKIDINDSLCVFLRLLLRYFEKQSALLLCKSWNCLEAFYSYTWFMKTQYSVRKNPAILCVKCKLRIINESRERSYIFVIPLLSVYSYFFSLLTRWKGKESSVTALIVP